MEYRVEFSQQSNPLEQQKRRKTKGFQWATTPWSALPSLWPWLLPRARSKENSGFSELFRENENPRSCSGPGIFALCPRFAHAFLKCGRTGHDMVYFTWNAVSLQKTRVVSPAIDDSVNEHSVILNLINCDIGLG